MAEWVSHENAFCVPDGEAVQEAIRRCEPKSSNGHGSLEPLRERLYDVMWQKVGIIRDAAGLRSALSEFDVLENSLDQTGIADTDRAFNLGWHDWLNLKSLVETSRVIAAAALARTDSRGAHFREDFPETGPLEKSAYTSASLKDCKLNIGMKPVAFTRVRPGESLLGGRK